MVRPSLGRRGVGQFVGTSRRSSSNQFWTITI